MADEPRPLKMVTMYVCHSPDPETRKLHGVSTTKKCEHCKPTKQPQLYSFGNDKPR